MRLVSSFAFLTVVVPLFAYACGGKEGEGDETPSDQDGVGGGGGDGSGSEPVACRSDKVCTPFDLLCDTARSLCVECLVEDDCTGDALCQGGSCVSITLCDSSKDCSSTEVCDDTLGYCVECVGDNDCADGQICAATTCHDSCDSSKDCAASDQVCGGTGFCVDCEDSADCADGSFCSNNACVPDVCEDGTASCTGDELLSCRADGTGFDATTCANGCTEDGSTAVCDGEEPGVCAGGTADPCSSIPKFVGSQTVDGDPEDFCDIPYKTLNVDNAAFIGGPSGAPVEASTITSTSSAQIKVAWSADFLHVHVHVVDPVLRVEEPAAEYNGDNVQIFIQGAEPAGGSTLYSSVPTSIAAADLASQPQQIFLVPEAGSYLGSGRLTVQYDPQAAGFDWAARETSDGYDVEMKYPWPAAVAPMTADKIIGFDAMVGVNDDAAPSSTREFEYGLHLETLSSSTCSMDWDSPWCDNATWCTPTTAE